MKYFSSNLLKLTFLFCLILFLAQVGNANSLNDTTARKPNLSYKYYNEIMPVFPGGQYGLKRYIKRNFKYPRTAFKDKIEGIVVIEFIINREGNIENITVLKSVRKDMDDEAIRLVSRMPRWKPALQDGLPVPVKFTLPFTFKLNR